MRSLDDFAEAKLKGLAARQLDRSLIPTHRQDGVWVERGGQLLMSFSCNDYLGLSHHPDVKAAACAAVQSYGAGAGASRLVTGDHPLISALETRLARMKQTEAACVFGSGYLANAGILPTLVGSDDLLLVDELAHACIWAGAKLSGAVVLSFRHNDMDHLAALLAEYRSAHDLALVATDTVFSMDGDLAPLDQLIPLCEAHDAWLLTDDAHGLGIVHRDAGARVPLQMGTLSKAVGSYGGYLCASRAVIDLVVNRARTLIYSTGLPPAAIGAAIASLDIITADPDLGAAPVRKARRFTEALNLPLAQSAIVPVIVGEAKAALDASRALADQGFLVAPIRPPTVPQGTARLRVAFAAGHPDAEVDRLAAAIRELV